MCFNRIQLLNNDRCFKSERQGERKKTTKLLRVKSVYSCLHVMATQWGVGPVAQGPQHGKKHISIERMSCSAGVIAPQSRNLWPLTSAKVCIYWDTDLCCSAPRSRRRRLGMNKEGEKKLWLLWLNHLSRSISRERLRSPDVQENGTGGRVIRSQSITFWQNWKANHIWQRSKASPSHFFESFLLARPL